MKSTILHKNSFILMIGFLSLWSLIFQTNLYASDKQLEFISLTTDDGLSHNNVQAILRDRNGFMWFATEDGLNRFDGYSFKIYTNNPKNKNSISANQVNSMIQDKDGGIWLGTWGGGLNLFDLNTETFTTFKHNFDNNQGIGSDEIFCLFEDSKNNLWIGTKDGGLNLFNKEDSSFTVYRDLDINKTTINAIIEDSNNKLWLGTQKGIYIFNTETKKIKNFIIPEKSAENIENFAILSLCEDKNKNIWIGSAEQGLFVYNSKNNSLINFNKILHSGINEKRIISILEDSKNNLWVGTESGGLFLLNKADNKFEQYSHNPERSESLSHNSVECIYDDRHGTLWIGTFNGGVNYYNANKYKFKHFKHQSINSISNNVVTSFCEDNTGNIWIGTDGGGLNYYNPKTGKFTYYKNNPKNQNSLNSNVVLSLYYENETSLWIGTYDKGLDNYNPKTKIFTHYIHNSTNENSLSNNDVRSIAQDKAGNIWVGTNGGGVNVLNHNTNKFKIYTYKDDIENCLSDDFVLDIFIDSKDNIWIGTWGSGLNLFDKIDSSFIVFELNKSIPNSISNNYINTIFEDNNGNIWVGTVEGLNRYNADSNIFTTYTTTNGLPNNGINAIAQDNNNLWISTNKGLSKFDLKTNKILNYDKDDGVQGNQFTKNAVLKTRDGVMYFGGINGFNVFNPSEISINEYYPEIVFTDFLIFNSSANYGTSDSPLKSDINRTKEIILDYKQSVLTFEFAALNYISSRKNEYAYKLTGFDKDWNYVGQQRRVTYTNLDPGNYIFRVKGCNNDGVWNEKGISVKLTILPPPWKAWWAYLLYVLLFLVLVYFFIKYQRQKVIQKEKELKREKNFNIQLELKVKERTNIIEKQKDELEASIEKIQEAHSQLVQAEKMASVGILTAGIAHEINNPLNYIQGGIYTIKEYITDKISEPSSELDSSIIAVETGVNRAIEIVKSLNHFNRKSKINTDECNIHSVIDNCLVMLNSKIKYKIKVNKQYTDTKFLLIGNEGQLHQVFLNILTNAVQAIEDEGTININTKLEEDIIIIKISDTGIGISEENIQKVTDPFFTTKKSGEGTGLGLSITYNIISEHKGTINFESEINKGVTVTVKFPIKNYKD